MSEELKPCPFRGLIEDWALVESDKPIKRAMLEAIGKEVKE